MMLRFTVLAAAIEKGKNRGYFAHLVVADSDIYHDLTFFANSIEKSGSESFPIF